MSTKSILKLFTNFEEAVEEYNAWIKIFNLPYKDSKLVFIETDLKEMKLLNTKLNYLVMEHYPHCLTDFLDNKGVIGSAFSHAIGITHAVKEIHEAAMAH